MNAAIETLPIDFVASDGGEALLTWGQLHMWRPITSMPEASSSFNVKRHLVIEQGVPVSTALAVVQRLVEHNQALRTHFLAGEPPRQRVERGGYYTVVLFDTTIERVAEVAVEGVDRMARSAFDLEAEWPARWLFVRADGLVRAVGLVASHVAVDGYAFELLLGQLRALLSGGEQSSMPTWQPLDQAAYEASPAALRRNQRSMEHWQRRLSCAPPRLFDTASDPATDLPIRLWRLHSEAIVRSALTLAGRSRTSTSTVLLAAVSLVLRALRKREDAVLKLIASNRYGQPRIASLVAPTSQDALFVCRPEDGDLLSAIGRSYRDATEAYFNAFYHPDSLVDLVARVARDRGTDLDLSAYFNDARLASEWKGETLNGASRKQIERLRSQSEVVAAGALPTHDMTFCVAVSHFGGRGGIALLANTQKLPAELCQRALLGVETVLCEGLLREVRVDEVADLIGVAG